MVTKVKSIITKLDVGTYTQKSQFKILLIIALSLALAFAVLSWLVFSNFLTGFDTAVEDFIGAWSFKGLHTYFDFATDSKTIILTTLIVTIILYLKKRTGLAILIGLATGGSWVLSLLLKFIFQRVRPGVDIDDNIFSYPSGHATLAICLYGTLIFIANKFIIKPWVKFLINSGLIFFIISIGLSRVYFGFHYPTDVLAGWFLGGSFLLFLIIGYQILAYNTTIFRRKV